MSDIGPRRTLDLRQPQAGQTAPAQPTPQPQPRPVQPQPRPMGPAPVQQQPAPVAKPAKPAKQPKPPKAPKPPKEPRQGGGVWKVILQFIIGFLVIAGVASAIVYLYLRYYA